MNDDHQPYPLLANLQVCKPLQRLYEKVAFEHYNLRESVESVLDFEDESCEVGFSKFKELIERDFTEIDPSKDLEWLVLYLPRKNSRGLDLVTNSENIDVHNMTEQEK